MKSEMHFMCSDFLPGSFCVGNRHTNKPADMLEDNLMSEVNANKPETIV